ncbi:MAG: hypothetical protein K2N18_04200, partial [Clostridia bacterium]|nr:hypothetical protein [Clostridia bacterium]
LSTNSGTDYTGLLCGYYQYLDVDNVYLQGFVRGTNTNATTVFGRGAQANGASNFSNFVAIATFTNNEEHWAFARPYSVSTIPNGYVVGIPGIKSTADGIYINSGGTPTKTNYHIFNGLTDFAQFTDIPEGFNSDYWMITANGALIFKTAAAIDFDTFAITTTDTLVPSNGTVKLTGVTVLGLTVEGLESSEYSYDFSTGILTLIVSSDTVKTFTVSANYTDALHGEHTTSELTITVWPLQTVTLDEIFVDLRSLGNQSITLAEGEQVNVFESGKNTWDYVVEDNALKFADNDAYAALGVGQHTVTVLVKSESGSYFKQYTFALTIADIVVSGKTDWDYVADQIVANSSNTKYQPYIVLTQSFDYGDKELITYRNEMLERYGDGHLRPQDLLYLGNSPAEVAD